MKTKTLPRLSAFVLSFLSIVFLQGFSKNPQPIPVAEELLFRFVSYEYGPPLQEGPDDFDIRLSYEVYADKRVKVIDHVYGGYAISTDLKIDEKLYKELVSLQNLSAYRTGEKMEEGHFFAGAYDYIAVRKGKTKEEICFITPLISQKLRSTVDKIYKSNRGAKTEKLVKEKPAEIAVYKAAILPLHRKTKLPLIVLPPPPAM